MSHKALATSLKNATPQGKGLDDLARKTAQRRDPAVLGVKAGGFLFDREETAIASIYLQD
jgi:hypothetical protein